MINLPILLLIPPLQGHLLFNALFRHIQLYSLHPLPRYSSWLPTSKRKKVLFITDSIGCVADIRHLKEATNTLIYKEKAYGAGYKANALKPNQNFVQASMCLPTKRDYSYAVLQGSSVDVTNLDTSPNNHNVEFLKQEVFVASQNMIAAAQNIVLRNPLIQKVLILDRPPRFDPLATDPANLKPKLSEYANEVLRVELDNCDVKEKIAICAHQLPFQFHQSLYGHPERFGFDGIHFHGSLGQRYLTQSICNILQSHFNQHSREPHNHLSHRSPYYSNDIPSSDAPSLLPPSVNNANKKTS